MRPGSSPGLLGIRGAGVPRGRLRGALKGFAACRHPGRKHETRQRTRFVARPGRSPAASRPLLHAGVLRPLAGPGCRRRPRFLQCRDAASGRQPGPVSSRLRRTGFVWRLRPEAGLVGADRLARHRLAHERRALGLGTAVHRRRDLPAGARPETRPAGRLGGRARTLRRFACPGRVRRVHRELAFLLPPAPGRPRHRAPRPAGDPLRQKAGRPVSM